ncbi:hemolysin family protein [Gordonia sp. HY285]|uniref:hemolysin family protein n=1 Tax=Gordonia liuliyuniae TaxID=2911517 RepID=UPI001F191A47|nr:hemolysin family protein [Gordonia liuliyuniae]MCF8612124.1 hemolysin family protein [Gordonia liuliyuniae]
MLTVLSILAGVAVVAVITAFTGYFVAQEFAYMAVDRSDLAARAEAGDTGAARALTVTRRTSFMLSGAQLGITVTGLLVGYVAEPLIGQGVGDLFGDIGVPTGIGVAFGAILAVLLSTVLQMVFGELFPKNLAIARPEPVARWLALSTTVYLRLFGWLIWLFDQSSNLLLRALRIEPVHDVEHSATPRDLEHIVAASRQTGELPPELSTLLDRILDFPTRSAEHAMIPRARVDVVHSDDSVADVVAKMSSGHTRYPVIGDDSDDLLGVIHLHDLLAADRTGNAGSRCRPPLIVPSSLPLRHVVSELDTAGEEMALVIDEYGGFDGVVTIEDIAEELVGEIADEHDHDAALPAGSAAEGWLLPGDLHIDEAERTLARQLPVGDYETVAGMVIAALGKLPAVGDSAAVALEPEPADLLADDVPPERTLTLEVREIENHVPASVFVSLHVQPKDNADG